MFSVFWDTGYWCICTEKQYERAENELVSFLQVYNLKFQIHIIFFKIQISDLHLIFKIQISDSYLIFLRFRFQIHILFLLRFRFISYFLIFRFQIHIIFFKIQISDSYLIF